MSLDVVRIGFRWFYILLTIECSLSESTLQSHPFLYFSQSDIESLRAKSTTTHTNIFSKIEELASRLKSNSMSILPPESHMKFISRWNEEYGNRLAPLAFYCLLRPHDEEVKKLTILFMDRMAGYPDWQVQSSPLDEVPVSHSLVGFATAYDFMYPVLDEKRRNLYFNKIKQVTEMTLYMRAVKAWWGRTYVQNHVATNVVALLTGSIVVYPRDRVKAIKWIGFAVRQLNRTLELLDLVVDGSMDEGTGYGSYTTRSLTQFVFLVKRHLQMDTAGTFWFHQHLQFMISTALPGFAKIIGIGDSGSAWFYGPESQLVFLDSYILKNGNGNWLASRIRDAKKTVKQQQHSEFCTLFTEYLWYDPSIKEMSPLEERTYSPLMRFSDAGLVTYNGGTKKGTTFFSFKSGAVHGRAVYVAVENKTFPWLQGWKQSLNPGHEHPDQNSFVFYPRGKPFITEALYGPKYTFLNNALTFGPSKLSKCFKPYEGQLGECGKWLDWKSPGIEHAWGEVIEAIHQDGMVFTSGEASGAYSSRLRLRHVYRGVLLLSDDVLLVVDHIKLHENSEVQYSNAFFHNLHAPINIWPSGDRASLTQDEEVYTIQWTRPPGSEELSASAGQYDQPRGSSFIRTHFVNISVPLGGLTSQVVYLFSGPRSHVENLHIIESTSVGIRVQVQTKEETYLASVVTNYTDPRDRLNFIDSLGYAQVRLSNGNAVKFVHENMDDSNDYFEGMTMVVQPVQQRAQQYCLWMVTAVLGIGMFVVLLCIALRLSTHKKWLVLLCIAALMTMAFPYYCYYSGQTTRDITAAHSSREMTPRSTTRSSSIPSVFITSLRGSGSYLLKAMFDNHTDFFYLNFPKQAMLNPKAAYMTNEFADACEWIPGYHAQPKLVQWFKTCFSHPQELLKHKDETTESVHLLKRRQLYPNSIVVLQSEYQNWNLKLPWLVNAVGQALKVIYLVRDPRGWIADHLKYHQSLSQWKLEEQLKTMFAGLDSVCKPKKGYPSEYNQLRAQFVSKNTMYTEQHKILALVWQANTLAALRINRSVPKRNYLLVQYEDLVNRPLQTARTIFSHLGVPFPMAVEHKLLQVTKTSLYRQQSTDSWKQQLSNRQIKDIENICADVMTKLNYKYTATK
ncbi:dermatan-sulfate epimerase-like protein [Corticium candelabrum]|uniref:dermatan-sulfate epimerase-like protein n=1 Tax=Corticium candelabrum TaxID=121492 RepID=UPI002E2716C7|nr:dermatan-sulfate epimerase-like protein [Corticium candelabrum]